MSLLLVIVAWFLCVLSFCKAITSPSESVAVYLSLTVVLFILAAVLGALHDVRRHHDPVRVRR